MGMFQTWLSAIADRIGMSGSVLTIVYSATMLENPRSQPSASWSREEMFNLAGVILAIPGAIAAIGMMARYRRNRRGQQAFGGYDFLIC